MKAIRYHGIQDVKFEEIPKPEPGKDEVLVKVDYAGICGSDLHIYNKGMFIINIPETMGHEFVGTVEKTGENAAEWKAGERVLANPMVPCMKCDSCLAGSYNTCENLSFIGEISQGCFAEYLCVPKEKLIRIPMEGDLKPFVLCEPLAVVLNICKRAGFKKHEKIAVLGAGPIGLLLMHAAKQLYEVSSVTALDLSTERLMMAKKAGADVCLTEANLLDNDYHKIIDAAGVGATLSAGIEHVKSNGALYVVSIFEKDIQFDINGIVAKQLSVVGCNVYDREDLEKAVEVIAEGKLKPEFIITHEFGLESAKDAFALLAGGEKKASKVIFNTAY